MKTAWVLVGLAVAALGVAIVMDRVAWPRERAAFEVAGVRAAIRAREALPRPLGAGLCVVGGMLVGFGLRRR